MIYKILSEKLNSGEDAMLCTIINSQGSVPRKKGALMLISQKGEVFGTIGGGEIEFQAISLGKKLLCEKKSFLKTYVLNVEKAKELGMVCGGSAEVFFRYVPACMKSFTEKISESAGKNKKLVTKINKDFSWEWSILEKSEKIESEGEIIFAEDISKEKRVYIFGGGHVSQETAPLLANIGFEVIVFEDRPEFAKKELFPSAKEVILGDFSRISESIEIKTKDFVLIMTRGHEFDFEVLLQVIEKGCDYIGVIGSRKKAELTRKRLEEKGFSKDVIDSINSPVGLPIKAETPAEIAISIAGQIILKNAEVEEIY